jgi:serine/threonine-protein kinase
VEWLSEPGARQRLQREVYAAARLKHPNIAVTYDVLDLDDRPCIVTEYVKGESLATTLRGGRLPTDLAVDIATQIALAVAEAHAHGVLHRDLKPGSIVLLADGRVKVLGFGLARMRLARAEATASPSLESSLAEAAQMIGTPGYAAPEQLTGKTADQRSDVFSIGAILFEMLTGRGPFAGRDPVSLALATVTEPVPPVPSLNTGVPPQVAGLVSRALEKNPRDRYQSAGQLAMDLRRVRAAIGDRPTVTLEDAWPPANPPARRPVGRRSAGLVGGLLVALVVIVAAVVGTCAIP